MRAKPLSGRTQGGYSPDMRKNRSVASLGLLVATIFAVNAFYVPARADSPVYIAPIALAPCAVTGAATNCIDSVVVISDTGKETPATVAASERGSKNFAAWDGRNTNSAELPVSKYVWTLPGLNHPDSGELTFIDVQVASDTWGSIHAGPMGSDERGMAPVMRVRLTPAVIDKRCLVIQDLTSAYTEDLLIKTPGAITPSNIPFPCETDLKNTTLPPENVGQVMVSNATTFLPRSLDPATHVRIIFKVNDFDPLGWIAHSGLGSSAKISTTGKNSTITLDLKAIDIASGPLEYSPSSNTYVDANLATRDTWSIDAFAPLNTLPTCFSGSLAIFTNSRTLELPVFDPVSKAVELSTMASHLKSNGDLNVGFYQANIGDQEAKCLWQVNSASLLAGQAVISISGDNPTDNQVASLSTKLTGHILTVVGGGFHYSAAKIKLTLKPSAKTVSNTTVKKAPAKPVKK